MERAQHLQLQTWQKKNEEGTWPRERHTMAQRETHKGTEHPGLRERGKKESAREKKWVD